MAKNPAPPAPETAPPPQPPKVEHRIEKLAVTVVRSTYVDGQLVDEKPSQPVVLYRARTQDVWKFVDMALNGASQTPAE